MAMSLLSAAAAAAAAAQPLLPVRRRSGHNLTTVASLSFPLKPHRPPPLSVVPPEPPRFSRTHSSSSRKPTTSLLTTMASTSRTLLFLVVASLLSFSGVRPLPSLASPPPPTQQPQETKGQEELPESEEKTKGREEQKESEEGEPQEAQEEDAVAEVEEAWMEPEEEDEEEVQMYLDVLSSDPADVDALKCVLYAKMRRADWDGALGYARRLREAEPIEVEWRLMEALLHELKGDLAGAERLFKEVLTEKPLLVRALHGLALCMHKRSEGPTVFEMLDKALQLAIAEERVPEERNIKLLIAQMHVVKVTIENSYESLLVF
ncbi:hypothetical protein GUJ93_ZPchr0005g16029 [Zizania palustris]|uniref:Uncharacterized protein n=1 Tax=Zizania palustris TaxID=103762 RepID=A0A8J5VQI8_ZIZPA|nr:hypothetical protein GUJ93_ZPchr0005g16029 [Zizania palustris]